MNKKLKTLTVAAASLIGVHTAFADNIFGIDWIDGWYISGTGSVAWHNNTKFNLQSSLGAPLNLEFEYKTGWGAGASIGAIICQQWRLEVEGLWRQNKLDSTTATSTFPIPISLSASGRIQNYAILANVYYDLPIMDCFSIYAGAGLGIAFSELKFNGTLTLMTTPPGLAPVSSTHHQTLFAWQVMTGLEYEFMDCVTVFSGYRLFMTTKPSLSTGVEAREIPLTHSIDVGIRLRL